MLKFGLKSLITEVQLNMMRHYVNVQVVVLITIVLREKRYIEAGTEVYIFEEIQDPQGNIWCRTYSPSNNGWVHKHTIEVEEEYK